MGMFVGCDVGMDWIDVQVLEPDRHWRLANKPKALERLAAELPAGCTVGMEATGTMHRLLADTLVAAGHTVYVLNPRWVHRYAAGLGTRGKSDRRDAMVIARYVKAEFSRLHAHCIPTAEQVELRRLLHRRAELVKLKTATRQSLGEEAAPVLREFKQLLGRIDADLASLLRSNPQWRQLALVLRSIPGVGPLVVAHLVEAFASKPFAAADSFIAHTGMDPRPNDSGRRRGRRRLTHHGDALLRGALFMAAMAASKRSEWRAVYDNNRRKGLPSTAALIVVARKLARVAFSLFKSGQSYAPQKLGVTMSSCAAS